MELTPTVLIGLGPQPAMGLTRFKQEGVWRPAPVRALSRVVFLGDVEPEPASAGAGAVHRWTREECAWVEPDEEPWGSEAAVKRVLNRVREQSLSAANLAAARAAAGAGTVYVREYQETYAPEACLLLDATRLSPESLWRLVRLVSATYERPVTLLLVLPAPYHDAWREARELVRQATGMPGLERIWLISPEQETGELLLPDDLADAINHYCHLFAYGGWPADPAMRPHFLRADAERTDPAMLATFGLQGRRLSAPAAVYERLLDEASCVLEGLLAPGEPADMAPALAEALARGREDARRRAPEVPLPEPEDGSTEHWFARCKLRWAPEAQAGAHAAVDSGLAPLLEWAGAETTRPVEREAELTRLLAAVRRQQQELTPPVKKADVSAAFDHLQEVRRPDRWPPLVMKGIISTIVSGALGWTFFAPGSAETATLLMAGAWAILIGVLAGLNLRDRRRAMVALQAEARAWALERVEAMAAARSLQRLEELVRSLEAGRRIAKAAAERLTAARHALAAESAAAVLPPAATACSEPAGGQMGVSLADVPVHSVLAADPDEAVRLLLERAWTPRPEADKGEEEPAPLRVPYLLLPVRAIQPGDGAPLLTRHFTLAEEPYLRVRFALTQPFALLGSARFDPELERKVEA